MIILKDSEYTVDYAEGGNVVGKVKNNPVQYLREGALTGYFESVNDFVRYLNDKMPSPRNEGNSDSPKERGRGFGNNDFHYFDNFTHASDVFLNDPGSLNKFKTKDEAALTPTETGREVAYDFVGDFIDVGRFLEGEPEHFGRMEVENPRGMRVNITMDMVAVWDIQAKAINQRMLRIGRLIDWLENNNIRTGLYAVLSNECAHVEIAMKRFEDRFDVNNVIVGSNSDFFRRLGFRFMEYSSTWSYGYGSGIAFMGEFSKKKEVIGEVVGREVNLIVYNNFSTAEEVDAEFDKVEADIMAMAEGTMDVPLDYVHVHGASRWGMRY